jgi:hypothetical protein
MTDADRRAALMARCDALEQHTLALREAFLDAAFKQEAAVILDALAAVRQTLASLPGDAELAPAEQALEGAALLLSALGRTR